MATTPDPTPDQPAPTARWLGVLRPGPGQEEITFGPFQAPWHAASVMASEVRRRQDDADAGEDAAIDAAQDAYGALLGDRAAMDRGEVAEPVIPSRRGREQREAEEATWTALVSLEGALGDPDGYARSGAWEVTGVAIGAMTSAPGAWRWSIRLVMEPLEEIASAAWQVREVADRLPALVAAARAQGKTWAQVGAAHGITRQAAQQRYGHSEDAAGS